MHLCEVSFLILNVQMWCCRTCKKQMLVLHVLTGGAPALPANYLFDCSVRQPAYDQLMSLTRHVLCVAAI